MHESRTGERASDRVGLLVTVAAAAALAAIFIASAADAEGLDGLLRFRRESPEVAGLGSIVMALFAAAVSLTCGALATGGRQPLLAAGADGVVKLTLLVAVAFMFAFPHLAQFEHKSLTLRAVFYPLLACAPVALYWLRGARGPYPTVLDLCLSFTLTFDIVSNDLHWYGTWKHWDDFVHFINSVPFMALIVGALLLAERQGAVRLGFWGAALFGVSIYTSAHALWEMYEFFMDRFTGTELQPGGMEEATRNNVAGLVGSLLGVALLWWWQRIGALRERGVEPLASYLAQLRRPAAAEGALAPGAGQAAERPAARRQQ